jgi:hypothetical protein
VGAAAQGESPEVYESYTDMAPGEGMRHLRMVAGTDASLYVDGAKQPCLPIHDLKRGDTSGGVALWIGPGAPKAISGILRYMRPVIGSFIGYNSGS